MGILNQLKKQAFSTDGGRSLASRVHGRDKPRPAFLEQRKSIGQTGETQAEHFVFRTRAL